MAVLYSNTCLHLLFFFYLCFSICQSLYDFGFGLHFILASIHDIFHTSHVDQFIGNKARMYQKRTYLVIFSLQCSLLGLIIALLTLLKKLLVLKTLEKSQMVSMVCSCVGSSCLDAALNVHYEMDIVILIRCTLSPLIPGIEERMHLIWDKMVVSCNTEMTKIYLHGIFPKLSYDICKNLALLQESGQMTVTDYVRVTSTEWYVIKMVMCIMKLIITKHYMFIRII